MKRIVILTVLTATILTLSSCGNTGTGSQSSISESLPSQEESRNESTEESASSISESETENSGDDVYTGIIEDGVFVIENCITSSEDLVVPEEINGVPVGKLASNAFFGVECRSITLPDSVTTIGENAFLSCLNIENIYLGDGLKTVGLFAFSECPKLKSIEFPDGMETIENPIFGNNTELEEVYIPSSVINLPERIASKKTCPKIIIVTPAGSAAEKVALAQGLTVRNP